MDMSSKGRLKLVDSSLHLDQHGHEHHVDLVRDGGHCSRVCVHPCIVEYLVEPLAVIRPQLSAKVLPLCTLDFYALSESPDCATHLNRTDVWSAPQKRPLLGEMLAESSVKCLLESLPILRTGLGDVIKELA